MSKRENCFASFEEAREFLRENPVEAKELIGFKGFRRRFFNVVNLKLNVSLRKLRETEKWTYYDVDCDRSHKSNPQLKIARDIDLNDPQYPLLVTFQKTIVAKAPKMLCRSCYILGEGYQVVIERQNIPLQQGKEKKVFIGLFDEKKTYVGSWSKVFANLENSMFHHTWTNTSNGGTHWEKGFFLVLPFSQTIVLEYKRHGAKKFLGTKEVVI